MMMSREPARLARIEFDLPDDYRAIESKRDTPGYGDRPRGEAEHRTSRASRLLDPADTWCEQQRSWPARLVGSRVATAGSGKVYFWRADRWSWETGDDPGGPRCERVVVAGTHAVLEEEAKRVPGSSGLTDLGITIQFACRAPARLLAPYIRKDVNRRDRLGLPDV